MTSPAGVDPFDRRIVLSAQGLLADFNRAEVLEAADIHVAQRLGALASEADDSVLLAVALVVRAARQGAVCLDLATVADAPVDTTVALPWPAAPGWIQAVAASPLVTLGVLRFEHTTLYLDRHWREEVQVCDDLLARLARPAPAVEEELLAASVERLFPQGWDEQRSAAVAAARQWTTVLTGGPGTGKTASVARVLALLVEQHAHEHGTPPRIALAAPTGKASTRLQESVEREAASMAPADRDLLAGLKASTIHRLLGWRPDSGTRFRHHRENPLPYDVIVLDEVSMVSLSQMARVLEAVRPSTRLLLVGDPGQLASVEAGAVLDDLVRGFEGRHDSPVQKLSINHRTQAIGESQEELAGAADLDALSRALRDGEAEDALAVLHSGSSAVRLVDPADESAMTRVRSAIADAAHAVTMAAEASADHAGDSGDELLRLLDDHRLLCAHREGPYGVGGWNRQVERLVADRTGVTHYDEWYPGRPILVTANDRGLGLSNGDLGVTVRQPDGRLRVLVKVGDDNMLFPTTRLSGVETVYAMTVHKSQGSEARAVTVILPPEESRLLTRQLFYTAVTRARRQVTIVGTESELRAAIEREVSRASGLAGRLNARSR